MGKGSLAIRKQQPEPRSIHSVIPDQVAVNSGTLSQFFFVDGCNERWRQEAVFDSVKLLILLIALALFAGCETPAHYAKPLGTPPPYFLAGAGRTMNQIAEQDAQKAAQDAMDAHSKAAQDALDLQQAQYQDMQQRLFQVQSAVDQLSQDR